MEPRSSKAAWRNVLMESQYPEIKNASISKCSTFLKINKSREQLHLRLAVKIFPFLRLSTKFLAVLRLSSWAKALLNTRCSQTFLRSPHNLKGETVSISFHLLPCLVSVGGRKFRNGFLYVYESS